MFNDNEKIHEVLRIFQYLASKQFTNVCFDALRIFDTIGNERLGIIVLKT